eukprot:1303450-Amphidinium_carterae.2
MVHTFATCDRTRPTLNDQQGLEQCLRHQSQKNLWEYVTTLGCITPVCRVVVHETWHIVSKTRYTCQIYRETLGMLWARLLFVVVSFQGMKNPGVGRSDEKLGNLDATARSIAGLAKLQQKLL